MTFEELNSVRELRQRVIEKGQRLATLQSALERITPILDGLPKGSDAYNRLEISVAKLVDLQEELVTLRDILQQTAVILSDQLVAAIPDNGVLEVMLCRYVSCKAFHEIAQELRRPAATIFRRHRLGLQALGISRTPRK